MTKLWKWWHVDDGELRVKRFIGNICKGIIYLTGAFLVIALIVSITLKVALTMGGCILVVLIIMGAVEWGWFL